MELSVVIPAYNEEKRIKKTLDKVVSYLDKRKYNYEIIVVDDGSKDKTVEVASSNKKVIVIKNGKNRGKGYTVKNGVLNASKEFVLFSDADLSTPIEELEKFKPYLNEYDVVIGSRKAKGANIVIKQPFYRDLPGRVFPLIVNFLVLREIKDTQCGFKLFKKDAAKILFKKQKLDGFSFDAEILYLAKKLNYKIKEVPIIWENDLESKLNPVKDAIKMFIELLKIKFNDIRGEYK